jgi:2-C-methyl-D-erythritol 2,4-cyclodiphosphate synthase
MKLRVGHGIDVHAFAEGRALILGGEQIKHSRGLIGHSDADVLTHAVMDALLGAAGFEDIGELFPDTDSAFKDANSLELLGQVVERITGAGWRIENVDCSLLLEAPRISPHRTAMRSNLAGCLGIGVDACTIKATTMEKLGFIGREEGVVASCTALLSQPS